MQIITTREFRNNMSKYCDLAQNETIFISRGNKAPVAIYAPDDDDFLTKWEIEKIQRGLEQKKEGNTTRVKNINDIWADIL